MSEEVDQHVRAKYSVVKRIGKGAYGIVYRAKDRKTGAEVALKKIYDAFSNSTDAQRTFREVVFLQEFKNHENIVCLQDVLPAKNELDLYLVFDFMASDLHRVIKMDMLKDIHKRSITYQICKALKYIHSGSVIHRDLKPSNILLDRNCHVKVCDFGLARSILQLNEDETNPQLTDYVATRWYRAPEILLGSKSYTKGVDMWSIGCIVAEMYIGKALFPGTDSFNQIDEIAKCLAPATSSEIEGLDAPYAKKMLSRTRRQKSTLASKLPKAMPDAIDLTTQLLRWNPSDRLTATAGLAHPYCERFHEVAKEPEMKYDVVPPLDDYMLLTTEKYRTKLYECMRSKSKRLCTKQHRHAEPEPPRPPSAKTRPARRTTAEPSDSEGSYSETGGRESTDSQSDRTDDGEESEEDAASARLASDANDLASDLSSTTLTGGSRTSLSTVRSRHEDSSSSGGGPKPVSVGWQRAPVKGSAVRSQVHPPQYQQGSLAPYAKSQQAAAAQSDSKQRYGGESSPDAAQLAPAASAVRGQQASAGQTQLFKKTLPGRRYGMYDAPQKEPAQARLHGDDYMKSFSAPNLAASGYSPQSGPHTQSRQSGYSHLSRTGRQPWRQASDRVQQATPTDDSRISFKAWTDDLHASIVPVQKQIPKPPPAAKIPRPVTKALEARQSQSGIARSYEPRQPAVHQPQPQPAAHRHTTAHHHHTAVRGSAMAESSAPVGHHSHPRQASSVEMARRSAALKAATMVSQHTTQSRRRQYAADSQFQRQRMGSFTTSGHGVISRSALDSLHR